MGRSKFDGLEIPAIEARIEDGQVFECSSLISVANAGGTGHWLFRTGDKETVINQRQITTNGDEFTYQVFVAPTLTGDGNAVPITNRFGASPNQPECEVFDTPTFSAKGAPIPAVYMPGATGQGNSSIGQFNSDGFVRVLSPNTEYLLEVTNDGAKNPASTEIYLLWAELKNQLPQV